MTGNLRPRPARRTSLPTVSALVASAVVLAGCSVGRPASPVARDSRLGPIARWSDRETRLALPTQRARAGPLGRARPVTNNLLAYASCDQLLSQLKREAIAEVGPFGLTEPGQFSGISGPAVTTAMAGSGASAATGGGVADGAAAAGSGGGGAYSGTNDQEAGVDEPDVVKTDGSLMVILRQYPLGLQVLDVSTAKPRLVGTMALAHLTGGQELMVGGNVVIIGTPDAASATGSSSGTPGTRVIVVSLADPSHPRPIRTVDVSGSEVSARLIAGHVELVVQQYPRFGFATPTDNSAAGQRAALIANRVVIAASALGDWMPAVTTDGRRWPSACHSALHPASPAGVSSVSVVSIDPSTDAPGQQATIYGNASVVYASTTGLYLAMMNWADQSGLATGSPVHTDIHSFDLSDPAQPRYLASGTVPGSLIGQYAMSEHKGYLRVATSVGQPTPPPGEGVAPAVLSDNLVVVLGRTGGALLPVGTLGGLGRGEHIQGVRFVGDLGYVVTFRQTDPLYIVDLADPTQPTLRGALELTGYSAYLHPLGGGLLVGIGQGVDTQGRPLGTQLSVFNVANVNRPSLAAKSSFPNSASPAENDPHAFLWWADRRLLIVPITQSSEQGAISSDVVLRVTAAGTLVELGHLHQPGSQPPSQGSGTSAGPGCCSPSCCYGPAGIIRTLVVGALIYTVSDVGVMASGIDSLNEDAWVPYQ